MIVYAKPRLSSPLVVACGLTQILAEGQQPDPYIHWVVQAASQCQVQSTPVLGQTLGVG